MSKERNRKSSHSYTKVKSFYFFLISVVFHSVFFYTTDIIVSRPISFTEYFFWGEILKPQVVDTFSKHLSLNKGVQFAKKSLFIDSARLHDIKTDYPRDEFTPRVQAAKKTYYLPDIFAYTYPLKREASSDIEVNIGHPYILGYYLKEAKFLLFISKDGYVKMVTKVASTGSIRVDRILENYVRKRLFPLAGKDYFREVIIRVKE